MSLSADDIGFVRDLFSGVPDLSTRRMFGGLGIYSSDVIFALMRSDGAVLIKATSGSRFAAKLADMGCERWTYTRKNGAEGAMPYWTLPDAALEDPDAATALAQDALSALTRDGA